MSTDINLLLECRDASGWQPALHVADRVKDPRTHIGILNVCWWSVRSRPTSLFFGDHAVIPFNTGLPADLSPRVYEYVRANFEDDATYAAWISLPDLDLASWHRRTVIVGGPVRAQYAHLFGDGNQPPTSPNSDNWESPIRCSNGSQTGTTIARSKRAIPVRARFNTIRPIPLSTSPG